MKRTCFTADIVPHSKNRLLPIAVQNSLKWIFEWSNVQLLVFYMRLGKCLGETYVDKKKAYDSECLSKMTVNLLHKLYRDGRDIVGLGPRTGTKRSVITEVNINTFATVIQEDRHASARLLER